MIKEYYIPEGEVTMEAINLQLAYIGEKEEKERKSCRGRNRTDY